VKIKPYLHIDHDNKKNDEEIRPLLSTYSYENDNYTCHIDDVNNNCTSTENNHNESNVYFDKRVSNENDQNITLPDYHVNDYDSRNNDNNMAVINSSYENEKEKKRKRKECEHKYESQ